MANIGSTIKRYRLSANFTQQYVAKRIGLKTTAYGNIERNKCKSLCLNRLKQIAEVLSVSLLDLIKEELSQEISSLPNPITSSMRAMVDHVVSDRLHLLQVLHNYQDKLKEYKQKQQQLYSLLAAIENGLIRTEV
jgi:transcriptional regulator with XRE-family HTH domain